MCMDISALLIHQAVYDINISYVPWTNLPIPPDSPMPARKDSCD